jgi:hypothetical protein
MMPTVDIAQNRRETEIGTECGKKFIENILYVSLPKRQTPPITPANPKPLQANS